MAPALALRFVRIFVRDWPRAVAFYSDTLGIPLASRSDDFGWAQLDTGAAQLALERVPPDEPEGEQLVGRFVGASLAVDDLEACYARLCARGVEFVAPPERMPWGGSLAHFRDPDGNVLTLVSGP